jgi:hypothetical protein
MSERSYYLDAFCDEMVPCDLTLEGWAKWLSSGGDSDEQVDVPNDGQAFAGSAIAWAQDIVATRQDGKWSLSRVPTEDDFVAVRYAAGSGWSPDNIISPVGKHESGWRYTYRAGPPATVEAERAQ